MDPHRSFSSAASEPQAASRAISGAMTAVAATNNAAVRKATRPRRGDDQPSKDIETGWREPKRWDGRTLEELWAARIDQRDTRIDNSTVKRVITVTKQERDADA